MSSWSLIYDGFDPDEEGLREALCTLGNGYFATRGANAEASAGGVHYPGTYLAGGYNRLVTEIAGRDIENEDLVNMPNWLCLRCRIQGGKWFSPEEAEILDYRQELDIKSGVLKRTVRFEDAQKNRVRLDERRIVHMSEQHLAALEMSIAAENFSGVLEIESALDGNVINSGVKRYRSLNSNHLEVLETAAKKDASLFLKVRTVQSGLRVALAARTHLYDSQGMMEIEPETVEDNGYAGSRFAVRINEGETIRAEKVVCLHTSRDRAISECGLAARNAVRRTARFEELLRGHKIVWDHLWGRFDIRMVYRPDAQMTGRPEMALRLHIFHLIQTTSMNTIDLDVGAPARGWHGEAYRGHIFWDELFIFPALTLQEPEITRSLVMYRRRRLEAAREAASMAGYKGAMFPWQSGSDGREESQKVHLNPQSGRWIPDNSSLQKHVNAAIAFNVCKYYESTGDTQFMIAHGAEMLFEIARFWADIATWNSDLGRYEILGVMGPDEYHDAYPDSSRPGLDNNAYTNIMAVWVLNQALELMESLPKDRVDEIRQRLGLTEKEKELWRDISRKMRVVFHDDHIISQFEGYEQLEELDWEGYKKKYGDIQRMDRILEAENDSPNRYKITKQADVLMLFYLFSAEELNALFKQLQYPFEPGAIPENIDYYVKRTTYGSTLSWIVHSWILARSDRTMSWNLFLEALESDLTDIQGGTTQEGIHLGAMAGTVNILQEAYMGIKTRGEVLWIDPCLPEDLEKVEMQVEYRGNTIAFETTQEICAVTLLSSRGNIIKIGFMDRLYDLTLGSSRKFII